MIRAYTIPLILLLLLAGIREAHPALCSTKAAIFKILILDHKEKPVSHGIIAKGAAVLLTFVGPPPKNTWSIVTLTSNGQACIIATGHSYQRDGPLPVREVPT